MPGQLVVGQVLGNQSHVLATAGRPGIGLVTGSTVCPAALGGKPLSPVWFGGNTTGPGSSCRVADGPRIYSLALGGWAALTETAVYL